MAEQEHDELLSSLTEKEKFYQQPKFWIMVVFLLVAAVVVFVFYKKEVVESMSPQEVAKSVQIVWHDSKWVDKKGGKPDEVLIVPSITIKIRNNGTKPLQYLKFTGVFQWADSGETISDGFTPALSNPLPPGQESEEIFIKSFFGYRASSKEAFFKNIKNWRKVKVRIFTSTRSAEYALLGVYDVKQMIEGVVVTYQ